MWDVLRRQFPGDEFLLRRMQAEEEELSSICRDLADALAAERHWASQGAEGLSRAHSYAALSSELAEEIRDVLKAAKTRIRKGWQENAVNGAVTRRQPARSRRVVAFRARGDQRKALRLPDRSD